MTWVVVSLIATSSLLAGNVAVEATPDTANIDRAPVQTTVSASVPHAQTQYKSSGYGSRVNFPHISTSRNIAYGSRSGSASEVLVIPSAEITTEDIATITEDMNIMSRIFEKNLQQAQIQVNSMFFTSSDPFQVFSWAKPSTQGMYLQGYGALFLMKVDFPLSPGPQVEEKQEAQQEKEEDVDPVWTEMKRDMYEPQETRKEKSKSPKKEYDAEKVENLKTTFIKSLKHATNIRSLKPDESVILTITGSHHSSGYKSIRTIPGSDEVIVIDKNNKTQIISGKQIGDIGLSLPTVLVIRAKKSDIDRFAKGDLDFDQFQQAVQVLTSTYLAEQSKSGHPFSSVNYPIR
jgi:hypothetical protein